MRPLGITGKSRRKSSGRVFIESHPENRHQGCFLSHMCYSFFMSKQLSQEEKTQLVQAVHSAVNHYDKSKRKTITQACEDLGLARSNYNRWRDSVQENIDETGVAVVPPPKSRTPKRNGKALPTGVKHRIEDMARSGLYTNPSQIGKTLREAGISVSDNTVRNNLEAAGLYGYRTVVGSDGKPTKKKVLLL